MRLAELGSEAAHTGKSLLGICMESSEDCSEFTYMIGVELLDGEGQEGLQTAVIPAASWAVFESVGAMPAAIQELNWRIYAEWFPAAGYEQDGGIDLEVYPHGDADSPDYRCEVWIPVKMK